MHGAKRVLVFCLMTTVIPTLLIITPLYLKHSVFAEVTYPVAESDVLVMQEGVSSVFCESLSLKMNSSFHAYQLKGVPRLSSKRRHIRLKKSMSLPDDTLEYWGFYLLKGASVKLKLITTLNYCSHPYLTLVPLYLKHSIFTEVGYPAAETDILVMHQERVSLVCSRFDGSRILVVRGEKNLKTCGLLEHNYEKIGAKFDTEHDQVKVTYEKPAELIGVVDKQEFLESVGGEDLANGEEVDIFVRNRIEKGRAKQLQKQNVTAEPDNVNRIKRYKQEEDLQIEQEGEANLLENKSATDEQTHRKRRKVDELYAGNFNKKGGNELRQMLEDTELRLRKKRNIANKISELDAHIKHGGNAMLANFSDTLSGDSASVSSFETDLLSCYNGQILLTQGFPPSEQCNDVMYLEKGNHMVTTHEVASDGYYYYIFYSDNDFVKNDIHAIFDIYKPTYKYSNTSIKECANSQECKFDLGFLSDEMVIVEVPTRDGIEHEADDITMLTSTCHPRMGIYMIFPILVLLLILGCAFL